MFLVETEVMGYESSQMGNESSQMHPSEWLGTMNLAALIFTCKTCFELQMSRGKSEKLVYSYYHSKSPRAQAQRASGSAFAFP